MARYRKLLVVKANGEMRITGTTRSPRLKLDEVAYPLIVDMPNAWGKVATEQITIKMPPPPTVTKGPKP